MRNLKEIAMEKFGLESGEVELSMGMTGDFEAAVISGSNNIRIGTKIFGERSPKIN